MTSAWFYGLLWKRKFHMSPPQMASNAENVSIWWRHHGLTHVSVGLSWTLVVTDFLGIIKDMLNSLCSPFLNSECCWNPSSSNTRTTLLCLIINTLRPRQNGRHLADDVFKSIFFNENVRISVEISLKFVPTCPINNTPALVQIMSWRRRGDKPISEVIVRLPTHICVTLPQWVNMVADQLGPGPWLTAATWKVGNTTGIRLCHRVCVYTW